MLHHPLGDVTAAGAVAGAGLPGDVLDEGAERRRHASLGAGDGGGEGRGVHVTSSAG